MHRPVAGYLTALRRMCDELGILLVMDEIYTGFGRTGAWFAFEREGVVPDILCIGKAMGSGFPISAAVGRAPSWMRGRDRPAKRCIRQRISATRWAAPPRWRRSTRWSGSSCRARRAAGPNSRRGYKICVSTARRRGPRPRTLLGRAITGRVVAAPRSKARSRAEPSFCSRGSRVTPSRSRLR